MFSPEMIAQCRQNLQQREKARQQANEERRQQARQSVLSAIAKVMPHYPAVMRVYLFGSMTRPRSFRTDSDIDIGIEGVNTAVCFDIWRDLERTAQMWNLDVRSLEDNDPFSDQVKARGELIYEQPLETS